MIDGETLLTTTRAVRKRLDLTRPVARHVIDDCLRIALQAPAAQNNALCRWIFVDDPAQRAAAGALYCGALASTLEARVVHSDEEAVMYDSVDYLAGIIAEVPVLAFPYTDGEPPSGVTTSTSWWTSVIPTIWSFQLALRTRELGSTYTSAHLLRRAEMADVLGLPARCRQLGMIPIAYTIGTTFRAALRPPIEMLRSWNQPVERSGVS